MPWLVGKLVFPYNHQDTELLRIVKWKYYRSCEAHMRHTRIVYTSCSCLIL